jgi:hypothetical protein
MTSTRSRRLFCLQIPTTSQGDRTYKPNNHDGMGKSASFNGSSIVLILIADLVSCWQGRVRIANSVRHSRATRKNGPRGILPITPNALVVAGHRVDPAVSNLTTLLPEKVE